MSGDMVHVKEELLDAPPGFTKHATALNIELGSQIDMQNPIQKDHNINRKRKGFPGIHTFSKYQRSQPDLPIGPMANGLDLQCDFNQTMANLIAKHGAIDKDCSLRSGLMKNLILLGIWKILKELRNKKVEELDLYSLEPYYDIVKDAEQLNINMKWLLERLDEIKEAIVSRNAAMVLRGVKEDYIRKRNDKRGTLKRLQAEVKKIEDEIDEVDGEIKKRLTKFQKIQQKPLLDGLI